MSLIHLKEEEREELRKIMRQTHDVRVYRRAQAILAMDRGERVQQISKRLEVGRSTLYDWAKRFQQRREESVIDRLKDLPRGGRPPQKREKAKEVILSVIGEDPRKMGYRYPVWTVPLLRHHIEKEEGIKISDKTIRRALKDLGYRYKRPRYVLARRSPHWRQAKGGLKRGLREGRGAWSCSQMPQS